MMSKKMTLDKRQIDILTSYLNTASSTMAKGDTVKLFLKKDGFRIEWVDAEQDQQSWISY